MKKGKDNGKGDRERKKGKDEGKGKRGEIEGDRYRN